MIVYLFFDLRYRRVPNNFFYLFFLIGSLFAFTELIINFNYFNGIFVNLIGGLLIFLSILYYLFQIKIFGGADCKLIILIFLINPSTRLSYIFLLFFYFFFSLYYFGFLLILFLLNNTKNKCSPFKILFETNKIQNHRKQIFLMMYFGFKDLEDLKIFNENKYIVANSDLIFNHNIFKLQMLIQYRAPLIPFIILAFFSSNLFIMR